MWILTVFLFGVSMYLAFKYDQHKDAITKLNEIIAAKNEEIEELKYKLLMGDSKDLNIDIEFTPEGGFRLVDKISFKEKIQKEFHNPDGEWKVCG
jgi:hypothetical protein